MRVVVSCRDYGLLVNKVNETDVRVDSCRDYRLLANTILRMR